MSAGGVMGWGSSEGRGWGWGRRGGGCVAGAVVGMGYGIEQTLQSHYREYGAAGLASEG